MDVEARVKIILQEIEDRGSVRVVDLAQRFDVSVMTVRRDLAGLEQEGLVRRVHGGAVSGQGRGFETPLVLREKENHEAKVVIGKMAADLIADGDSVALDIGTTTLEVARNLVGRHNLTVITPSLIIANILANQSDIFLILTGGIVRHGELSLIGDLVRRAIEGFNVDRLFLGVGAIDSRVGLTEYNWDDALTKQVMIQNSKEVILLTDASKFEKVAFARVAPLRAIHQMITNQAPPPSLMAALKEAEVVLRLPGMVDFDDLESNQEGQAL